MKAPPSAASLMAVMYAQIERVATMRKMCTSSRGCTYWVRVDRRRRGRALHAACTTGRRQASSGLWPRLRFWGKQARPEPSGKVGRHGAVVTEAECRFKVPTSCGTDAYLEPGMRESRGGR